ncbi:dihydrosphingosine-1-phosphate lyase [Metschnikowia bicuspidata var. bicuspidata NRRL YB-4993]|uniref:sphinganine-1-phosphate aldolase n=1 Tax=Metschnikowia bicuspidata var. bicuspidata NRRL YB-4993 TaxID=869754 RepID=A0A1A0H204_9ASCO|nr:dihydrosphingosine-1-phosphate lyase [Metschnikowia bicuspidata var. bicuspidata NRRL YB-4993]OBA17988.1 dihydrosphingosine-1-phosphate lyase [Metschnikowia bicuspidata var. bicuspidata NRRL YB-4993]
MSDTLLAYVLLKVFGEPYLPTDFTQLIYVLDLHARKMTTESLNIFTEKYIMTKWGAILLIRDAVFVWFVWRVFVMFLAPLIMYGPLKTGRKIVRGLYKRGLTVVMSLPPIRRKVDAELAKTLALVELEIIKNDDALLQFPQIPEQGMSPESVLEQISQTQSKLGHSDWQNGRVSGAVYHGGDQLLTLQLKAYELYSVANQLHPDVFPGIRKMEAEVVAMVLSIFNGPDLACGSSTSGGTESLLLAGLAAREHGKKVKGITRPEVIAPVTVHAGIEKACYYFGMTLHKVDVDPETFQVDLSKMGRLINRNTVLLVGSAPNYPHGIIDDIEGISRLAVRHNIPLHVDACLGSFIVTFLERLQVHGDKRIPLFDFRVPGVTSISCDTHKYGFAPKGSSVIMYRDAKLRECQYYVLSDWTGGMYGLPTLAGSRPGALMAGCWATLLAMGVEGYTQLCMEIVTVMKKVRKAIETEPLLVKHLRIIGDPIASVVAFQTRNTSKLNIYQIGDAMLKRGWHLASLQNPAALHFAFTRLSVPVADAMIADLIDIVESQESADSLPKSDTAALYGVAGNVSTAGVAERVIVGFLDALYKL